VQQRLGGYRPELPHTADMEMWMRFAMHGPVGVLRAVQGYYRRHEENMSARYFSDLLADQRERAQACMQALGQAGARLPQRDHWCRLMHRRLGTEAFWLASRAYDEMDFAASDACLRFAAEHHPRLRRSAMWWRFRAKRALGPALWQRVRPLLRPAHRGRGLAGPQFEAGDLNGWWPDAC
jgi:hypothetical protein